VLLVVALGGLLPGCVEVMSSPAPRPLVISDGLGATRREWEHEHKLNGPFEGELNPARLRGLIYDGSYRVTYWADGPQEAAPASARISRIEFDTSERDPQVLKALARQLLPNDAALNNYYGLDNEPHDFSEVFMCPTLASAYEQLAYTDDTTGSLYGAWVSVMYSDSTPNITIHIAAWGGVPPEGWPPNAIPTLQVPLTPVVYR
jgi:hypothetical protein